MAKLARGKCKNLRNGRRICNIPGVGVRFQSKGGTRRSRSGSLSGTRGKHCIRFKYVNVRGRGRQRRCAKFG